MFCRYMLAMLNPLQYLPGKFANTVTRSHAVTSRGRCEAMFLLRSFLVCGFTHVRYTTRNYCRNNSVRVHAGVNSFLSLFLAILVAEMPSDIITSCFPYFSRGEVVKGFGRGSKELGIPTANFPVNVVDNLPEAIGTGIYYGWASVDRGPVYKMVMSIGWNPFYKNTKKSMETHIIHSFEDDFYGSELSVVILGFIRPEKDFSSLESLVEAIHSDIREAEQALEKPENQAFLSHNFFSKTDSDNASGCT